MLAVFRDAMTRLRLILTRLLARVGLGEESFLVLLAAAIGVITAAAAIGFHELIEEVRHLCFVRLSERFELYKRDVWMLAALPAAGGLVVGIIGRYVYRGRGGGSVIDVMESVGRASGGVRARSALEKIVASAVTIGTGGSAGAEGPIVTIGAAIASLVGRVFGIARQHMPILTGCGTAAGISAIFNSPLGGVLFTLEVILRDFSIRTFAPVVIASVIANVTVHEMFQHIHGEQSFMAIFQMPGWINTAQGSLNWEGVPNYLLLGMFCGFLGATLTRLMYFTERRFARVPISPVMKPAIGGLLLGVMGVLYVMLFGWFLMDGDKPVEFKVYSMPAFFGDGYGVVQQMLTGEFYDQFQPGVLAALLIILVITKIFGTCFTLGSGGSGGVIAPSLFLGAAGGAILGIGLETLGVGANIEPRIYALIGMGAVLAAVVHAPLASILIVLDLTRDPRIMLPTMLATIVATGLARLMFRDSIYTLALRERGIGVGESGDLTMLRRLSVEQVELEPATVVNATDPFQRVLDLTTNGLATFVVVDKHGSYKGMVLMDDVRTVLLEREAVPLLLVHELMRTDLPLVRTGDDLASVFEMFARYDVSHLPVAVTTSPGNVVGLISRAALMRRYQKGLGGAG
ncbi:MAG TPA: chloride channel protein [Tepidisphaeraceae bacterium]|nr:chloride channel protein [Tepidisphaeraceae bacterium]